LNSRHC